MKVDVDKSTAGKGLTDLIQALAALYDEPDLLEAALQSLWPDAEIYKGDRNWRIHPIPHSSESVSVHLDL